VSRDLPPTLQDEVERRITSPGWLVEFLFPGGPARFSSRGDVAVLGSDWVGINLDVDGVSFQGANAATTVTIRMGNADNSIGALLLSEGIAGVPTRVWVFYGDTPTEDETQLAFYGQALGSRIPEGPVLVTASPRGRSILRLPNRYITKENGYSILPARGAKITVNGEVYVALPEE